MYDLAGAQVHFKFSLIVLLVVGDPDGCWDDHGCLPWLLSPPACENLICNPGAPTWQAEKMYSHLQGKLQQYKTLPAITVNPEFV